MQRSEMSVQIKHTYGHVGSALLGENLPKMVQRPRLSGVAKATISPKTVGGKAQYPEQMHLNKPLSAGGCGVPI